MAILVLGLILAVVLFFALGFTTENDEVYTDAKGKTHVKKGPKVWRTGKKQFAALAVLIVAVVLSSITVVTTGTCILEASFSSSSDALAMFTPPPAKISGRFAVFNSL